MNIVSQIFFRFSVNLCAYVSYQKMIGNTQKFIITNEVVPMIKPAIHIYRERWIC